jgi:16S rRNA G966 N2-methylase RsmD
MKKMLRAKLPLTYGLLYKWYRNKNFLIIQLMNLISKSDKVSDYFYRGRKRHLASNNIFARTQDSELEEINIISIEKGPFKSLLLKNEQNAGYESIEVLYQKKFGIYEQEILDYISNKKYSILIDVGAGTGYYSLGMLKFKLCEFAILFESNPKNHSLIQENFDLNQINSSRFTVKNEANAIEILTTFDKVNVTKGLDSLLICDIEGSEHVFFQPDFLQELAERNITLCIEIHKAKYIKYSFTNNLVNSSVNYFDIVNLPTMQRNLTNTFLKFPLITDRWAFASEGRNEGAQLLCVPKPKY